LPAPDQLEQKENVWQQLDRSEALPAQATNHFTGIAADRTAALLKREAVAAGKLACPQADICTTCEAEPPGEAIVTDRLGRQPLDQRSNLIRNGHAFTL
jgi:hypothetical protein